MASVDTPAADAQVSIMKEVDSLDASTLEKGSEVAVKLEYVSHADRYTLHCPVST